MQLTETDINNYQGLIKKRYGVDISKEEALKQSASLINLLKYSLFPKSFDYGD